MKKLFLAFVFILNSTQTVLHAGNEIVAAGLKGTYNNLPAEEQQYSTLMGAVIAENGDLSVLYKKQDIFGELARLMFHELDGKMRCTQLHSNAVVKLPRTAAITLINAIRQNQSVTAIFFKKMNDKPSLEDLTSAGHKWFTLYKTWQSTRHSEGKIHKNFLSSATAFIKNLEKAREQNPLMTCHMLLAWVYLNCQTPSQLQDFFNELYPAHPTHDHFTAIDFKKFSDLFMETTISQADVEKYIEQMVFYLIQKNASDISFLRSPLRHFVYEGKEFPTCVEDTLQTLINCLLYDKTTKRLSLNQMLLPAGHVINEKFKIFLTTYDNPHVPNYYQITLAAWMELLSNIPLVNYNEKEVTEIFPEQSNLVIVINYLFNLKVKSLEDLKKYCKNLSNSDMPIDDESGYDSDTNISDEDENEEEDDDDDQDEMEEEEITLTFFNLLPEKEVVLQIELDPEYNHSKTRFITSQELPTPNLLHTMYLMSLKIGYSLKSLFPYDLRAFLKKYVYPNVFFTSESFTQFLQEQEITNEQLLAKYNFYYLVEDFILWARQDLLEVLRKRGIDIVHSPTHGFNSPLEAAFSEIDATSKKIPEYLASLGATLVEQEENNSAINDQLFEQTVENYIRGEATLWQINHLLEAGAKIRQGLLTLILKNPTTPSDVVELLLSKGANAQETNKEGQSSICSLITRATNNQEATVVEKLSSLLKYGANPNCLCQVTQIHQGTPVQRQETPLQYALSRNWQFVAQLLLDHNADVTMKDSAGNSALDYALKYCNDLSLQIFDRIQSANVVPAS